MNWFLEGVKWDSDRSALKQAVPRVRFSFAGKESATIPENDAQVKQVHGHKIVEVTSTNRVLCRTLEADGVFTRESGMAIGVKTADCVPVVVFDQTGTGVAALHAGWRGMFSGIIPEAIDLFVKQGVRAESLRIHVGPCISSAKFEVGPEVVEEYFRSCAWLGLDALPWALSKGVSDRWHIDLALVAVMQAAKKGVSREAMVVHRHCTYQGVDYWNSFRRDGRVVASNWSSIEILAR